MKRLLPWITTIVLALVCLGLYRQVQQIKSSTTSPHDTTGTQPSRAAPPPEPSADNQVDANELAELRKDRADLLRLRNEVGQLRQQSKEFEKLRDENKRLADQVSLSDAQRRVLENAAARSAPPAAPAPAPVNGNSGMTGLSIAMRNNQPVVNSVIENSPASRAKIQPGSVIVAVDGVPLEGLSMSEVVQAIRGEQGTTITLDLLEGTP